MNRRDEVLTILAEECAEVIVAISKIKRFGEERNKENLKLEIADLRCMLDLVESFQIVEFEPRELTQMIQNKQKKLEMYSNIFR